MNLIDLLLQLQVPAWLVLALGVIGAILLRYYTFRLDQAKEENIKRLEHTLESRRLEQEKTLELIQERHRKKLDALDQVNAALLEFDHAVMHLLGGDDDYARHLEKGRTEARKLGRQYESLLGEDFYNGVVRQTDIGSGILHATFTVTEKTLEELEKSRVDKSILITLADRIGKPVAVTQSREIVNGIEKRVLWSNKWDIFHFCTLSSEFDRIAYENVKDELKRLIDSMLRKLPMPSEIQ